MSMQYTGGVEYTGGCSVHQGNIMSTVGDMMINVGKVNGKTIEFLWKARCTEHPPMYS